MILVDTTVWIDFFADRAVPHVAALERMLFDEEDLCTCGIVLTEVLQGLRKDDDCRRTLDCFDALLFLPMSRPTFIHAAQLYRSLRHKGLTIRKPADCMIAAVAIEHGAALLHHDRDFDVLASHAGLKIVAVQPSHGRPNRS